VTGRPTKEVRLQKQRKRVDFSASSSPCCTFPPLVRRFETSNFIKLHALNQLSMNGCMKVGVGLANSRADLRQRPEETCSVQRVEPPRGGKEAVKKKRSVVSEKEVLSAMC
jgi:hypothetical protein